MVLLYFSGVGMYELALIALVSKMSIESLLQDRMAQPLPIVLPSLPTCSSVSDFVLSSSMGLYNTTVAYFRLNLVVQAITRTLSFTDCAYKWFSIT